MLGTPASSPFLIFSAGHNMEDVMGFKEWGPILHHLRTVDELWLGAALDARDVSWDIWWLAVWCCTHFRDREEIFGAEMAVVGALRCVLYYLFANMKCLLFAAKPSRVVIERLVWFGE